MLFYLDSNQDKQDQNLLCYHYTIEQFQLSLSTLLLADAKVYTFSKFANKLSKKMSRKNTYVFRIKHVHVFSKRRTCFFKSL